MKAEVFDSREFHTDRACRIGRIEYTLGAHNYVALAFRYLAPAETVWRLTWIGVEGGDTAQLPPGIYPSREMLVALERGESE